MSIARAALALAAALLVPAAAGAQTLVDRCDAAICKARLTADQLIGVAQQLIAARRYKEAAPMLEALRQLPDHKLETRFLSGLLAAGTGDHKAAANFYEAILSDDPSQTRVRLELAREMLALGHRQSADKQFKIAEQDKDLPPDIAATIRSVRDVIRSKRAWRLDFNIGIAPDSNINNATSSDTVTILWGGGTLPVTLDKNAQAQSGIGATATLSSGLRLPVTKQVSALVDLDLAGNKYGDSQFDDYQGQLAAGAEVNTSRTTSVSLEAVGAQRWFGDKPVSQQIGVKAGFQARLNNTSQIGLQIDSRHTNAMFDHDYDGWQMAAYATYERAVSKSLVASAGVFVHRDSLTADAYSNTELGAILGFGGELRHGVTFGISGTVSRATFAAPMPLFSLDPRKDWRMSTRATIGDRKIRVLGFSPQIEASYSRIDSSIPYYSNDRLRFQFTLARYF